MLRRSETEQATKKRLRHFLGIDSHVPIVVVTTMILAPREEPLQVRSCPAVACVRCFSTSFPSASSHCYYSSSRGREKIRSGKQAKRQANPDSRLCTTTTHNPQRHSRPAPALSRDPRSPRRSCKRSVARLARMAETLFLPFPLPSFPILHARATSAA